jgi:ceramide glucosyltransferase
MYFRETEAKAKGKRQKAKGKSKIRWQAAFSKKIKVPNFCLLPFAFCLLPFSVVATEEFSYWLTMALAACALAACSYSLVACLAALAWQADVRRQRALPSFTPPVTILKPLRGAETEAYATLATFCRLDYPTYQIVFGVKDPRDPVIAIVEQLRADFPRCDSALVVNETTYGYNGKVSNLINALTVAKHDVLLIADSDIRVTPDYLRRVVRPVQDEQVGMVTCMYRGVRAKTVGDLLENLGLAALFAPEVLMARMMQGVKFALGATIVMRRETLERIGGFAAIADHLADDYELGHRVATQLKQRVVLSEYVVDHVANAVTLSEMLKHQLRWMRAIRVSRPAGYAGLIVTYGITTASLLLLASGFVSWAWWLWLATVVLRFATASVAGVFVLRDYAALRWLWLLPMRELLAFGVWVAGFFGDTINWCGERLRVLSGGRMAPIGKTNSPNLTEGG